MPFDTTIVPDFKDEIGNTGRTKTGNVARVDNFDAKAWVKSAIDGGLEPYIVIQPSGEPWMSLLVDEKGILPSATTWDGQGIKAELERLNRVLH
jgi:hypothetical protein